MDDNTNTNNNFRKLPDPESAALIDKLDARGRQMRAQEMGGGIKSLYEDLKGKLEERSADADLKKIAEEKLAAE